MIDFVKKDSYGLKDLETIVSILRAPGGCPWDAEQTHGSIRRNFLEETYEALDAIDRDDPAGMCEELGDVLMQAAFHAQIEAERGRFTMDDVVDGVSQKLVYRHPHVFGTVEVADSREVLVNWEALKRKEKAQSTTADAIEYYVNIQKNDWCPNQNYFAETSPGTSFFSGMGSMFLEGSWNLLSEMKNYPDMVGKWDIAMLPRCPDPVSGDGRGSISNGLCYSTAARGKNLETVKEVLRFFGSEEGQRIQGESGAAIPAYLGLEDTWSKSFGEFDYMLDLEQCYGQFDHAVQYINNASRRKWKSNVADEMVKIYKGEDIDSTLARMQEIADSYVTTE